MTAGHLATLGHVPGWGGGGQAIKKGQLMLLRILTEIYINTYRRRKINAQ
jgi:hypothetical protein